MFDIIIGNPPYQKVVGPKKSQAIWPLFIKYSLELLKEDGYLLFVHPSGWRNPHGAFRNIYNKILDKNLIYLNMNDTKKGQEIFKAATNFDYYLLCNNTDYKFTLINDIDDKEYKINLQEWEFIPSGKFNDFEKLLIKNKEVNLLHSQSGKKYMNKQKTVNILYSRSEYGTDKKNIKRDNNNNIFKYPCIYTITQTGVNYYYSSEKKGHFDIPKVIWSNGMGTYVIKDEKGEYGLTQFAYAIVDKVENLEVIKNAMNSKRFIELMKYASITTNNKYNHKVIGLFKKDFYKEFI